jgi:hypothetical protein
LVGIIVVAVLRLALFMTLCASQSALDSRLDLHQRWLMPWSVSQVAVEQFGRSLQCFGHSSPLRICTWACISARSSLGRCRICDLAFLVTFWAFESALDLRLGFASALAHTLVSVGVLAVILLVISGTPWALESAMDLRQRWHTHCAVSRLWWYSLS